MSSVSPEQICAIAHLSRINPRSGYLLTSSQIDYQTTFFLSAEQGDPVYAKKKLKWDRKFRVEESNFETRKKDIELQTEAYKRDYSDMQVEICNLETLVKRKTQKLDELRKEIKSYQT